MQIAAPKSSKVRFHLLTSVFGAIASAADRRLMTALYYFVPDVEIYAIDEAFLDLSEFTHQDLPEYSLDLRKSLVNRPPDQIIF